MFRKFSGNRTIRFLADEETGSKKCFLPGVIFLDIYKVIQRDTRLKPDDYKLDTVLKYMDLGSKEGLKYKEIYPHFLGTPEMRGRLTEYCITDTQQCARVAKKSGALVKLIAKSRVKRIRPQDEMYRGASFTTLRKVQ